MTDAPSPLPNDAIETARLARKLIDRAAHRRRHRHVIALGRENDPKILGNGFLVVHHEQPARRRGSEPEMTRMARGRVDMLVPADRRRQRRQRVAAGHRQQQRDRRAETEPRLDLEIAAVRFGRHAGNRQAETEAMARRARREERLDGLPRTNVAAERNAAMGFEVSEASADYADGAGRKLRLEINDTGGAKGLIAFAAWANVEQERQWDGGYERNYRADGRMVHERWDENARRGEYKLVVANRFALGIEGEAASMDELKSALASGVDLSRLEAAAATPPK